MKIETRGILLSIQSFSEHDLIGTLFTADHGIISGIIPFGQRGKNKTNYQVGNFFDVNWSARLEEHLGKLKVQFVQSYQQHFLFSKVKLACLNSCVKGLYSLLPEKNPQPNLYKMVQKFIIQSSTSSDKDYLKEYFKFELELLSELGFGCDLSCCALTGQTKDLAYISPITGRAACREAGKEYAEKLLCLPEFLCNDDANFTNKDLTDAYMLIDHFLHKHFEEAQSFFTTRKQILKLCA